MFEMIGLLFSLFFLFGLSIVLGLLCGVAAWLLFLGRHRPKALIATAALIPPLSAVYLVLTAIVLAIFVPNQPDEFFGDFAEPLPNGYLLKGLGKMPDYAYFDTSNPSKLQPRTLGSVLRLEQDGPMVFGAYGHLNRDFGKLMTGDQGYFAFDTRTGQVQNFDTLQKLNALAGHTVHMVESQYFRSQEPERIFLRRTENLIFFGPPSAATLLCFILLVRFRLRGSTSVRNRSRR
jgi:hypothetical protein